AMLMEAAIKARLNIVISGGTGCGKTTLLNTLSSFIPHDERVVTIEDAAELQLQQDHVVRLETRPANIEGKGAISTRDLVRNALRMRPERIIIGKCRGAESLDMLQAMNTGHAGSMTTLHANTPRDAQARSETMIMMAGMELPIKARWKLAATFNGNTTMISTTALICLPIFVAVSALVGVLGFVLRDSSNKGSSRLDALIGKRRREDSGTDILRKTAFESDKKSLL